MDILLGKKKSYSGVSEQLRQLSRQVEFLKRENSELRLQLEDGRQATRSNKLLIDQLFKIVGSYQANSRAVEERLDQVESKLVTHDSLIANMQAKEEDSEEAEKELVIFADSLALSQMEQTNPQLK